MSTSPQRHFSFYCPPKYLQAFDKDDLQPFFPPYKCIELHLFSIFNFCTIPCYVFALAACVCITRCFCTISIPFPWNWSCIFAPIYYNQWKSDLGTNFLKNFLYFFNHSLWWKSWSFRCLWLFTRKDVWQLLHDKISCRNTCQIQNAVKSIEIPSPADSLI